MSSCLSSSTQFSLLLFPVPKSHMMCLLRKKNMIVQGSYSSYIVLKSGTCDDLAPTHASHLDVHETHLVDVAEVDGGEVLDAISYLVEHLVLPHAVLSVVSFCVKVTRQ